jgi:hypothetical protein
MIYRALIRTFWILIPHPFIQGGQFASAVCRRCGYQHWGKWF